MKNKYVAAVLALFLGTFGIQKFYLGKTIQGVLCVLFCWTFVPTFLGLYDFITFLLLSKGAFDAEYNKGVLGESNTKGNAYPDSIFVLHGISGNMIVYENKIAIVRKGFIQKFVNGFSGEKTIPYKYIQGVEFKKGTIAMNGHLQIIMAGTSNVAGSILDAGTDVYSVIFTKAQNGLAEKIKKYIEDKIL